MEEYDIMNYTTLLTEKAPAAIGPYSQGVKIEGIIYTSGQLPINVETGELETDIRKATEASINNCKAIIESSGSSLKNVAKTLVFMKNMDDFAVMNEVYSSYFTENYPARSCVQVQKLPKDAVVEIEMIAVTE